LRAFISHNKEDKESARILATSLVEHGVDVWFDDWKLRPGDSIVGGIETGLRECDVFVLVWSKEASNSQWVGTEVRSYLRRRIDEKSLRIIPIMLDNTPLPVLVADYRGFVLHDLKDLYDIAAEIVGRKDFSDIAQRLQKRLHELAGQQLPEEDPIKILVCPQCASKNLIRYHHYLGFAGAIVYFALCKDCHWGLAKEATRGNVNKV
jgi:hypothetical protein